MTNLELINCRFCDWYGTLDSYTTNHRLEYRVWIKGCEVSLPTLNYREDGADLYFKVIGDNQYYRIPKTEIIKIDVREQRSDGWDIIYTRTF